MQTEADGSLIGITALAEQLALSRRTLHRIVAQGDLPTLKIGRRRLVRLSVVRHWLAGKEKPALDAGGTNLSQSVNR